VGGARLADGRSTLAALPFPQDAPSIVGLEAKVSGDRDLFRKELQLNLSCSNILPPVPDLEVALVMSEPTSPQQPNALGGLARRVGVSLIIAGLCFGLLWYTVFDAMTAAFVASGGTVLLVAGSNTSDAVATVFETLGVLILTALSAIGAFLFGILSIFH
jgi:hypothetical protein